MVINKVGVWSCAKVQACLMGIAGLIVGVLATCLQLVMLAGERDSGLKGFAMMLTLVLTPLLYGFIGMIVGVIQAAMYNFVASLVGGIEIELEQPKVYRQEQTVAPWMAGVE